MAWSLGGHDETRPWPDVSRAPVLIIGIGNPSRGDDALGPAVVARIEELLAAEIAGGHVETLIDFQLQLEHTLDIAGRETVFIVDASSGSDWTIGSSKLARRKASRLAFQTSGPW